jgi:hypothetical protein
MASPEREAPFIIPYKEIFFDEKFRKPGEVTARTSFLKGGSEVSRR